MCPKSVQKFEAGNILQAFSKFNISLNMFYNLYST